MPPRRIKAEMLDPDETPGMAGTCDRLVVDELVEVVPRECTSCRHTWEQETDRRTTDLIGRRRA